MASLKPGGSPPFDSSMQQLTPTPDTHSKSTAPRGRERREAARVQVSAEVGVYSDSNFFTGFTEDISEGGLFIATYDLEPIGTIIEVEFTLPGNHALKLEGEVRWLRDPIEAADGMFPGMGVRFVNLDPREKELLQEFCAARPPLFYDE